MYHASYSGINSREAKFPKKKEHHPSHIPAANAFQISIHGVHIPAVDAFHLTIEGMVGDKKKRNIIYVKVNSDEHIIRFE